MKVTLTQHDALHIAAHRIKDMFPDLSITAEIMPHALPPAAEPAHKITAVHTVELIKFARRLAADIFEGKITACRDADGHPYFGIAEAKRYVEDYFKF